MHTFIYTRDREKENDAISWLAQSASLRVRRNPAYLGKLRKTDDGALISEAKSLKA